MASRVFSVMLRSTQKFKRCGKSPKNFLERLPSEILMKILSYLDASTLFTLSVVSKQFHALANDNLLWRNIYLAEFGKDEKKRLKRVDDVLLKMAKMELQRCADGHWKLLFFKTLAARDMNKWKRRLRVISQHTGLPSQTEQVLRNLNVTWELTVSDKSGREDTLELRLCQFCETSVYLCFDAGGCSLSYKQISTLQLHGVRRIALSCPGLKNPGWRSLMATFNMQTLSKNAQLIGQDKLIQLKLLQPGIIVCTWKDQHSIAFIMLTLHYYRLVERSIQGSPISPFVEPIDRPPFDDVDPQYGLHGYQLHIVLHNTMDTLMSERFSQLSCHRTEIREGLIRLTAISKTNLSLHTRLTGNITLPWRCEVLKASVENCCIMSLTLLDEFRKPFWCISSPVFMKPQEMPASYHYDGDHFQIHYSHPDGLVKISLVWLRELKQFMVISLKIYVSVSKVNEHFHREY